MATLVEELRHKLQITEKERVEFSKKFTTDELPTEDDERKLDAMLNGAADLKVQIARAAKFGASAEDVSGILDLGAINNPAKTDGQRASRIKTFGQMFIESAQYNAARKEYIPDGGRIPDGGAFKMGTLGFRGLADLGMRADIITSGSVNSAGAFLVPDRQAEIQLLGRQPLTVLDLIRNLQTSGDVIEYVAQLARTNNADTVAEATASGDASGYKPESAFTFEVRQAAVKTIANWIPVTRQAMSDVPQLRGYIDTELLDNLREALASKVLNGPGGTDITGINNTSGTQSQTFSTNVLATTRKARTKVRTVGRTAPTGYVMNPIDWEAIDLLQDNEARYFYGGPAAIATPRLWGLPVAEDENEPAGQALIGNFNKAIMWDREQGGISVSDSHADFFVRNLLAILAEMRAAFAVVQPTAFVEIALA